MQGIENANKQYLINAELDNYAERTKQLKLNNELTEEQFSSLILEAEQKAIGKAIENEAQKANIALTKAQTWEIGVKLNQAWDTIEMKGKELSQKDKEIAIERFKAELSAKNPALGQLAGL